LDNLIKYSDQKDTWFFIGAMRKNESAARDKTGDSWEWSDGKSWDFYNWKSWEPTHINENVVGMSRDGTWFDITEKSRYKLAIYKKASYFTVSYLKRLLKVVMYSRFTKS